MSMEHVQSALRHTETSWTWLTLFALHSGSHSVCKIGRTALYTKLAPQPYRLTLKCSWRSCSELCALLPSQPLSSNAFYVQLYCLTVLKACAKLPVSTEEAT